MLYSIVKRTVTISVFFNKNAGIEWRLQNGIPIFQIETVKKNLRTIEKRFRRHSFNNKYLFMSFDGEFIDVSFIEMNQSENCAMKNYSTTMFSMENNRQIKRFIHLLNSFCSQPCPEHQDYRAHQCAAFDEVPYDGTLFKWTPHYDYSEPCALTCR